MILFRRISTCSVHEIAFAGKSFCLYSKPPSIQFEEVLDKYNGNSFLEINYLIKVSGVISDDTSARPSVSYSVFDFRDCKSLKNATRLLLVLSRANDSQKTKFELRKVLAIVFPKELETDKCELTKLELISDEKIRFH